MRLKEKIRNEFIPDGPGLVQRGKSLKHYQPLTLKWHLARMPDERLPKRVLFGHMDGSK